MRTLRGPSNGRPFWGRNGRQAVGSEVVESDVAAIGELLTTFLCAVSFGEGGKPSYGDLPDLFIPSARLIRNSGSVPDISTVEEFVRSRQDAVDAGESTSFDEPS